MPGTAVVMTWAKSTAQRVGIFVDVQNMFYSAKTLYQAKIEYSKLLEGILAERDLVRAIAFIVQKADVNQAAFHEALSHIGFELRVKELKVRTDPDSDRGTVTKGSWDVGLAVEVMTLSSRLDTVVLVTGDGEYVPLVQALRKQGLRVEIVGFEGSTSGELIRSADQFIPISIEWTFKEEKFVQSARQSVPPEDSPSDAGSVSPGTSQSPEEEEAQPVVEGQPVPAGVVEGSPARTVRPSRFGILS